MTNPTERVTRPGFERAVPRTAQEFSVRWQQSGVRQKLLEEIEEHNAQHPFKGDSYTQFAKSRLAEKSTKQRKSCESSRSH